MQGEPLALVEADAEAPLLPAHAPAVDLEARALRLGDVDRLERGPRRADLGRVVDRSWDPPVTLGVRLVSVIADDLQHAGQAAFVRGILQP